MSLALIDTTTGACFMHHDLGKQWQRRLGLLPDPACQILAGGILQSGNVIEVMMIEPSVGRFERGFHIRKVHHPSGVRIYRAAQIELDTKRMPMHTRTFVSQWHMRQAVCGLDRKGAKYFRGHTGADSWSILKPEPVSKLLRSIFLIARDVLR